MHGFSGIQEKVGILIRLKRYSVGVKEIHIGWDRRNEYFYNVPKERNDFLTFLNTV
jgi:hypothetical protein